MEGLLNFLKVCVPRARIWSPKLNPQNTTLSRKEDPKHPPNLPQLSLNPMDDNPLAAPEPSRLPSAKPSKPISYSFPCPTAFLDLLSLSIRFVPVSACRSAVSYIHCLPPRSLYIYSPFSLIAISRLDINSFSTNLPCPASLVAFTISRK